MICKSVINLVFVHATPIETAFSVLFILKKFGN